MSKKRVLFVCIHNSARSQMAEAFLKKYRSDRFEVESAGLEPGKLNSVVVEVMKEAGVAIDFKTQDARNLSFDGEFDLAIMLCEGGFSLMETDEMNFEILKEATKALKSKGKFIFTALNGLFPLFHSVNEFYKSAQKEGQSQCKECSFDLMTFRDHNTTVIEDDSGNKIELKSNERYYVPSEIKWLLKTLGYQKIDIFGAKLGAYSRNDKLTTDDFEMLVVAEK